MLETKAVIKVKYKHNKLAQQYIYDTFNIGWHLTLEKKFYYYQDTNYLNVNNLIGGTIHDNEYIYYYVKETIYYCISEDYIPYTDDKLIDFDYILRKEKMKKLNI